MFIRIYLMPKILKSYLKKTPVHARTCTGVV